MKPNCDLCGAADFQTVSERDRRNRPLATVVCRQCGLISHEQIPTEAELVEYYAHRYRQDYHGEVSPSPRRVLREWRRGRDLFRKLRPYLSADDRVFEIGAGIGCNVKQFELSGFDASGIEPGEGFLQFSQHELKANIRKGVLEELPSTPRYDFILLVHVLEHLRAPVQSLAHIRSLLRPGGKLYVEVPNCGAPHAAPGKLFHFAHLYNFTSHSLTNAGRLAGFEATRVLSHQRGRNLAVLFTRSEQDQTVDSTSMNAGYEHAMQALHRYNALSYHLRRSYLLERAGAVLQHQADRLGARRKLQRILQACREHAETTRGGSTAKEFERGQAA